jgi:hypothetical protein
MDNVYQNKTIQGILTIFLFDWTLVFVIWKSTAEAPYPGCNAGQMILNMFSIWNMTRFDNHNLIITKNHLGFDWHNYWTQFQFWIEPARQSMYRQIVTVAYQK